MANVEDHLEEWLVGGVLAPDAADRIRAYERAQVRPRVAEDRPGVLEVLLYLGVVVLSVGVFSLFAQNWDDLESWARVMAIGVPTVLLIGVGAALHRSDEPQLERGGQAAWMVSVGLFAGLAAVVTNEYELGFSDLDDRGALLAIALATFGLAVILWIPSPSYPQLFAIAAATFFLGQAMGDWPDEYSQQLAGMTILGLAVASIALAEAGWFTPVPGARLLFGALAIIGPFEAGVGDGPIGYEFLAGAMAAAVVALGVWRGSFLVVLVGVAGSFLVLITFIMRHFSDRLGAPVALMISGGILVAGVLLLALYRRELQERKGAA